MSLADQMLADVQKASKENQEMRPLAAPSGFLLNILFQDHAVLQRNVRIPIFGKASPGDKIRASIAGVEGYAFTDDNGSFLIHLPPRKAGGPFTLTVENITRSETLNASDLYIGEVWLASGQSNMRFSLAETKAEKEIAASYHPLLRYINCGLTRSPWRVISPETAGQCSGVAYYFAKKLQKELGCAVGIICNAVGGSIAESWLPASALARVNGYEEWMRKFELYKSSKEWIADAEAFQSAKRAFDAACYENRGFAGGWNQPDANENGWQEVTLPSVWQKQGFPFCGVLWFRKTIELPPSCAGKPLFLNLGRIDKTDISYFNGKEIGRTGKGFTHETWNTPRSYRVPGELVKSGKNTIAVRVFSFVFNGGLHGKPEEMYAECGTVRIPLTGTWQAKAEARLPDISFSIDLPREFSDPAYFFESLCRPLIPFAIKGVIWYQGEANAAIGLMTKPTFPLGNRFLGYTPQYYKDVMVALIREWRRHWELGDIPFLQVQLPGFGNEKEYENSAWAQVREAQRTSSLETGNLLAVCRDLGDIKQIHPLNKTDVGERLVQSALKQAYGKESARVACIPERAIFDHGKITVFFSGSVRFSTPDQKQMNGFFVSGRDGVFKKVSGEIFGNRIVLNAESIREPHKIRFAWASYPKADLCNEAGIPVPSFELVISESAQTLK